MKRKNIVFIASIVGIFLILTFYNKYQENQRIKEQQSINTNKEKDNSGEVNPYAVFDEKGACETDYIPNVMTELGETVRFRFGKNSNGTEFGEAEIMVEAAALLNEPKNEDAENEDFKGELAVHLNKNIITRYEEDLRYLYVDFIIKNVGKTDKTIDMGCFRWTNETEFGTNDGFSLSFDHVKLIEDGEVTVVEDLGMLGRPLELEIGKEYKVECIALIDPGAVYDLYLITNASDSNYTNDQVGVRLDLANYETMEWDPTDGVVCDIQKRDLKKLRINAGYTSYSYFEGQTEGYYFTKNYFFEYGVPVGNPCEQAPGEVIPGTELTVLESKLIESKKELPDRFKNSEYINSMLEVYMSELPYAREEYRYVYTKVKLKQFGNLGVPTIIADQLWMYNRDDNDNLWIFGYPDDYYVISSTNEKQTIEYQELLLEQNEEIVVEAVYIAVPDTIYDLYIYNDATGVITRGDTGDNVSPTYGAASLNIKKKETGGIK